MARKNPFANLLHSDVSPAESEPALDYAVKGASRSFLSSINEIAARADKAMEGQPIVELDPKEVSPSFVRDRLEEDGPEFEELLAAIRERGQDTPILVRTHPNEAARYMVVFGHRRLKAAATLGRTVRAVIRELTDNEHVLAQGQENSARANLSFIEKALYAAELVRLRYDQDNSIVLAALSIDRASLSKMLSVAAISTPVLHAIGAAKSIGRDRWYELKLLLDRPANSERAASIVEAAGFTQLASDERFNLLLRKLKTSPVARARTSNSLSKWAAPDGSITADVTVDRAKVTMAFKTKGLDAKAFGDYLSGNLNTLYEEFRRQAGATKNGA